MAVMVVVPGGGGPRRTEGLSGEDYNTLQPARQPNVAVAGVAVILAGRGERATPCDTRGHTSHANNSGWVEDGQ